MSSTQDPCAGKSGNDLYNCIASSYGGQGILPPDQVKAKSGQQILSDASGLTNALGFLGGLTNPTTWQRVGIFLLALVFVIVGFWVISGEGS